MVYYRSGSEDVHKMKFNEHGQSTVSGLLRENKREMEHAPYVCMLFIRACSFSSECHCIAPFIFTLHRVIFAKRVSSGQARRGTDQSMMPLIKTMRNDANVRVVVRSQ